MSVHLLQGWCVLKDVKSQLVYTLVTGMVCTQGAVNKYLPDHISLPVRSVYDNGSTDEKQCLTSRKLRTMTLILSNNTSSLTPVNYQIINCWQFLPHKVKTQYVHVRLHRNCFLLPCKISEEIMINALQ